MPISKRSAPPMILSANSLLDGAVVYRSVEGWSPRLADARVARDEQQAVVLEAALATAQRTGDVIDPELVSVDLDAHGGIVPVHYRERIRALGPTVRTDLGPQGEGEHSHVSL